MISVTKRPDLRLPHALRNAEIARSAGLSRQTDQIPVGSSGRAEPLRQAKKPVGGAKSIIRILRRKKRRALARPPLNNLRSQQRQLIGESFTVAAAEMLKRITPDWSV